MYEKDHLIFDLRKKISPQLGLEPTKVRQDLKKSMAMRGWAKYQSRVKNNRFYWVEKKSSWTVTGLQNRETLKDLNDSKQIVWKFESINQTNRRFLSNIWNKKSSKWISIAEMGRFSSNFVFLDEARSIWPQVIKYLNILV